MADTLTLKDIFQQGYNIFKKIETDESSVNSDQFQNNVSEATRCLRTAMERVNDLALFSKNEHLDDISTNNLRYLLLPALLGDLALRSNTGERIDVVKLSKIYLLDFLERCKTYGFLQKDLQLMQSSQETSTGNKKSLENLALERQAKIARYKKLKEQEKRIEDLSKVLQDPSVSSHDEELERKYNILLLDNWMNKALDHISSINNELQILEHIQNMKQGEITGKSNEKTDDANSKKNQHLGKPILITRESIKNKVFGAGYPSLPTMTQEECFEKELREGKIVAEFEDKSTTKTESDDDDKDENNDESCEDEKYFQKLKKDREWDDWKDDNRRGWGNRENMG